MSRGAEGPARGHDHRQYSGSADGFVVAVIVGILAIQLVRWLIRSDNFIVFSIYTLLVSIGTFAYWFIAARG